MLVRNYRQPFSFRSVGLVWRRMSTGYSKPRKSCSMLSQSSFLAFDSPCLETKHGQPFVVVLLPTHHKKLKNKVKKGANCMRKSQSRVRLSPLIAARSVLWVDRPDTSFASACIGPLIFSCLPLIEHWRMWNMWIQLENQIRLSPLFKNK